MIIYPAVDIKDGKCVRLIQGRAENTTVFEDNPVNAALRWQNEGAEYLHLVDLDGAFEGVSKNLNTIKEIVNKLQIPVQLGGGIRSLSQIESLIDNAGLTRIILGTAAVNNPDLVKQAVDKYGNKIAVGIDAKNGNVAVNGWVEECNITAAELTEKMRSIGISTIIYTDISRDGMLIGPNIDATKSLVENSGIDIIASGGISNIEDVIELKEIGVAGSIIGKALYTGKIELKNALACCGGTT